ncbi:MAG: type III PLP-dependent enzyme, partial [Treponema sp.]|nr:type III PLP-dependent enzyme [Treponema sp.]
MINRCEFISDVDWERFLDFSHGLETPCIVINLQTIKNNYVTLRELFPHSQLYYAVKANPESAIVSMLAELGSNFDIASRPEFDMLLALAIDPARVSYGNTIKKLKDIAYFYEKGVRLFATDSEEDLKNIASAAPGSKIYVRIMVENSSTADWPLSRKFGCHSGMAYDLLVTARDVGLTPYGISFHVGSQQRDIGQWNDAIAKATHLLSTLEAEEGIHLGMVNMGGGFPA